MRMKSGTRRDGMARKAEPPCRMIVELLQALKQYAKVSKRSFYRNERLLVEIRGEIMRDTRKEALCKAM